MSGYELIPEATYNNLPQDPIDQFVVLVNVAQGNLSRLLDQSSSGELESELRSQFMSTICGIAEALSIDGLPTMGTNLADYNEYHRFQVYLAGVVAKVRLQSNLVARPYSVALGRRTKARLQLEIDQLKHSVSESDLPNDKKAALLRKLGEFEEELAKQRISFARVMGIASSITLLCGGVTTTLADAPKAIETVVTIIQLIGEDKEKEEQERLRLLPPPSKALPNFVQASQAPKTVAFDDMDDDVPF
jgi:hypothetical protein